MFGKVMARGPLASELLRLADEARAIRERLARLARRAGELRVELERPLPVEPPADEPARLHSVQ